MDPAIIYGFTVLLVFLSALFSGLTLGLMSLDTHVLKRKADLGDKAAQKIYPVRNNGNLLLCTLLLGNVAVNSTLAIMLNSIASGVVAGAIATGLILIFGEILPQALFSRYATELGARSIWLVRIFQFLLYPLCWPLAWALDRLLGEEVPNLYSKHELVKIIEEHEISEYSLVDTDEKQIVKGALTFSEKTVDQIMTPRTVAVMIEESTPLTRETVLNLKASGHSRIPVYRETVDSMIGILYMRELVGIDYENSPAGSLCSRNVHIAYEKQKLDHVFNDFISTKQHLFIVVDEFGGMAGLISIEDILEEIVGAEIVDESDRHTDMQQLAKLQMAAKRRDQLKS